MPANSTTSRCCVEWVGTESNRHSPKTTGLQPAWLTNARRPLCVLFSDPYENRTHLSSVRGWRPTDRRTGRGCSSNSLPVARAVAKCANTKVGHTREAWVGRRCADSRTVPRVLRLCSLACVAEADFECPPSSNFYSRDTRARVGDPSTRPWPTHCRRPLLCRWRVGSRIVCWLSSLLLQVARTNAARRCPDSNPQARRSGTHAQRGSVAAMPFAYRAVCC